MREGGGDCWKVVGMAESGGNGGKVGESERKWKIWKQ